MTTAYYKSVRNYARPQSSAPVHVPQPFLNYGGLSQMLNSDYQNPKKEENSTLNNPINPNPKPVPFTRVPQQRALSARQRFEQNQKLQVEREQKLAQRAILNKTNPGTNPWARSSAFTQPLQRTRGALGYYQNAHNNSMVCGFPGVFDVQKNILLEKERDKIENKRKIMEKISDCGIRQLLLIKF